MSKVVVTKGGRCPKGRDIDKPLHIVGPLRDFHNFESAKDKVLETDLHLDGNMSICHGIKICLFHKLS